MRVQLLAARERAARFAAGFRAVFERDFLAVTSSGRFVVLRTAVILVLATLPVAFLVQKAGGDFTRDAIGEMGRRLFRVFAWAYPLVVLLIGPALAAGSLAGERSLGTLPLVLSAPVAPSALVLAKALSRLLALLVPLIGGLPIAGTAFLYGGVSPALFRDWLLVSGGFALMAVSASIVASAYSKSVAAAILGGYFAGIVAPVSWSLFLAWWCDGAFVPAWVLGHTPVAAFRNIVDATGATGVVATSVLPFVVASCGGAVAALLLSAGRLSREGQSDARRERRRGRRRRMLFANPVLDRATGFLHVRSGASKSWIGLAVVGAATWAAVVYGGIDDETVRVGMMATTWTTALIVLARATQTLALERQQGSLAVLLATPFDAGAVILAKLAGLLLEAGMLLLPGVALAVAGWHAKAIPGVAVLAWAGGSLVVLLLAAAFGMRASAHAPTAGRAAATAIGTSIGGLVAFGVLFAAAVLLFPGEGKAADAVLPALPPVALFQLMEAAGRSLGEAAWPLFWTAAQAAAALWFLESALTGIEEAEGGVG